MPLTYFHGMLGASTKGQDWYLHHNCIKIFISR